MNKTFWGIAKEFLTILVIPAIIWFVKLESDRAADAVERAQINKSITKLENRLEELKTLENKINAYAVSEARIEGKLDSTMERLHEIRTILDK